jgi:hypothetical protein
MGFLRDAFAAADFAPRATTLTLSDLAPWFDGPPEWTVRGLTAAECARCDVLALGGRAKLAAAVAAAGEPSAPVPDLPVATALRVEYLVAGSVEPAMDYPTARQLSDAFPVEFLLLTGKIVELTGKGSVSTDG